ncbi:MAG TPA: formate dehydrogenase accessory sulfurtransferase FdhD [Steroidobacteraceae bacterium]|nr:formate dehydrogenase accessory sulfurtransferase FdhD [Steroidobacteraceae bacterium]
MAAAPEDASAAGVSVTVERWERGLTTPACDRVAEEVPVALLYNGEPHVVMLATPANLEDLGWGFTLSEELVAHPAEIRGVEVEAAAEQAEVRIAIAWERFPELLRRRRNLTGRTGCGLCGAETLQQAVRAHPCVGAGVRVSAAQLHQAIERLGALQPLNASTGSVHAAAWVVPGGAAERGSAGAVTGGAAAGGAAAGGEGIEIACVREDVGRHNALDKCIGALVRQQADFGTGFMLVTSRASYEMVQKAAAMGISLLAAFSAPTSFAVQQAQRSGMTLVAFARRERHVVYAHPERLVA